MERITFKEVLDHVSTLLNCKNTMVASLIGVQDSTLSANKDKLISDVATKKAGKRLIRLMGVVAHFSDLGLSSKIIMKVITDPVHINDEGFGESVRDVILMDKYDRSVLIEIGTKAYNKYVQAVQRNHRRFLQKVEQELQQAI